MCEQSKNEKIEGFDSEFFSFNFIVFFSLVSKKKVDFNVIINPILLFCDCALSIFTY